MKERGTLKRVFHTDERSFNITSVVYDGRYLWAPVIRPEPLVLVIDPVSERVWHVTAADGLPPTTTWVLAAPLGEGRACVVGAFGRTWCASVSFDPRRGADVKVVHEARKAVHREDAAQATDPHVAFHPAYVFAVAGKSSGGADQRRVVIGRTNGVWNTHRHPLLFDPSTGSVELTGAVGGSDATQRYFTPHAGAIHWIQRGRAGANSLHRFGLPALATETLAEGVPDGTPAFDARGRVHVAGRQWWTSEGPAGPFRALRGDVPQSPLMQVFHSNHYGLLLLSNDDEGDGGTPYQVEFRPEALPGGR